VPFSAGEDCLKNIFISEYDIIDRFVGNQLWVWGKNTSGQLGTNDRVTRSRPVQTVSTATNWASVEVSDSAGAIYPGHMAAIKTDGTLWMWGYNNWGQLGNNNVARTSSPVQTVSVGTNWKQASLSTRGSMAIKTDGTLWGWGCNLYGQLGTNDRVGRSSPVQVVGNATNWKQISVGGVSSGAIKTDGTLWMWGINSVGNLGTNDVIARSSPVQVVGNATNWKQISVGGNSSGAIKTDGTLWMWGTAANGVLGDNLSDMFARRSSPVQTVSGGTNWKCISIGDYSVGAIKTDGTLWMWGRNTNGQLGTNNILDISSPVQTVSAGTNWKSVSLKTSSTGAVKTDGTLWTWGDGTYGALGSNAIVPRSSPTQTVASGTTWKSVSIGVYSGAVTFKEL
jgi:alpha-tubulin suppressor-like RCC1 family protein